MRESLIKEIKMAKVYDYKEIERKLRVIKTVILLRLKGKTFREIAKKAGIYPVQACDIWHTNKNYKELDYLK